MEGGEVGNFRRFFTVHAKVVPAVANAAEGIDLAFNVDPGNDTLAVAFFLSSVADKGGLIG